jgi:hypothetical protein
VPVVPPVKPVVPPVVLKNPPVLPLIPPVVLLLPPVWEAVPPVPCTGASEAGAQATANNVAAAKRRGIRLRNEASARIMSASKKPYEQT